MINSDLYDKEIWQAFQDRFNPAEEYLGVEKEINQKTPLVSVCVPTFNHEHIIQECLDSILAQKTDFTFEILIGEDDSQDNTRAIVKEYAENHQDTIRLFLRDSGTSHFFDENGKNVFNFNHKWLRKSARGTYIALCDGDDFWVDDQKLQKQINFMQSNPDLSMCFHNAKVIYSSDEEEHFFSDIEEGEYTGVDIYERWLVPTSSAVFRTEYIRDYRHAFNNSFLFGDLIIFLTMAERGKIWYLDEVMSVYRRHEGGILHGLFKEPENIRKFVTHQKEILRTFSDKYRKAGHKNLSWIYFLLFRTTLRKNIFESFNSLLKSFYYSKSKATHLLIDLLQKRFKS